MEHSLYNRTDTLLCIEMLQRYTTECEILHRTNRWHIYRPIKNGRKSNLSGAKKYHGMASYHQIRKEDPKLYQPNQRMIYKTYRLLLFRFIKFKNKFIIYMIAHDICALIIWKYRLRRGRANWTNVRICNVSNTAPYSIIAEQQLLSMNSTLYKQHCMTFACNLVYSIADT